MKITIVNSEREFDVAAAWKIIGQLLAKPDSVIGLSTGRTTKNMHEIVSDIYRQYPFDASKVTFFGVDELTNLPRSYAGCCWTMIEAQLTGPLGIPEDRFLMPPTISEDHEGDCRRFQQALEDRGGIDLQILGLGQTVTLASTSRVLPLGARHGFLPWMLSSRRGSARRPASRRTMSWAA